MKKFKKIVCLSLALMMSLILIAGCGKDSGDQVSPSPEPIIESSEPSPPESSEPPDTKDDVTFSYSNTVDENGFYKGIRAVEYIEMFNYKGLPIPKDVHEVTDDKLQTEIDTILARFPVVNQVMDREVAVGDTVNIDFVGSIDGVEFENGSAVGMEVIIGETSFIDDFLDQLVGHMPGETVNVEVTFPEDYNENTPELNGKDALFVTVINHIVEREVLTELTDEFVMTNMYDYYSWTSADEMIKGMREEIGKYAIQEFIRKYLTTEVVISSVPDLLVEYMQEAMLSYYQANAANYGMELEDYISNAEGYSSVDELIEAYKENNTTNAIYFLVLQAIAEDAGMSVSDGDLDKYFLKPDGSSELSLYVDYYGLQYVKHIVLVEKVIELITENAVLLDV